MAGMAGKMEILRGAKRLDIFIIYFHIYRVMFCTCFLLHSNRLKKLGGFCSMIVKFVGKDSFLSNFYEIPVEYNGIRYRNAEAAFQAQKCSDESKKFCELNAFTAIRLGRYIKPEKDWETRKLDIMYEICKAKFQQNRPLIDHLLDTGDQVLVNENNLGDRFWGTVQGIGGNHLGKILMQIRNELRKIETDACDE